MADLKHSLMDWEKLGFQNENDAEDWANQRGYTVKEPGAAQGGQSYGYSLLPQDAGAPADERTPQSDAFSQNESAPIANEAPQASPPAPASPMNSMGMPQVSNAPYAAMKKSIQAQGDLAYQKGMSDVAQYDGQSQALNDYDKVLKDRAGAREKAYTDFRSDWDQNESKIQQAEENLTKGFWSDKNIGDKIGAALGYVVSAVGAAGTGKENMAYAVIQQQMKDDLEKKKTAYQTAMNRGKRIEGAYGHLMDKYKDTSLADTAYENLQLNKIQTQLSKNASLYGGLDAQKKADFLSAQIDQQKQANAQSMAANFASNYGEVYADRLKSLVDLGNGEKYTARNPDAAKDIIDRKQALDAALEDIKQIEELNKKSGVAGFGVHTGRVGGELEARLNSLATNYILAKGTPRSALNKESVEFVRNKYIGDPKSIFSTRGYIGGQLGQMRDEMLSEFNRTKELNRMPNASLLPLLMNRKKK